MYPIREDLFYLEGSRNGVIGYVVMHSDIEARLINSDIEPSQENIEYVWMMLQSDGLSEAISELIYDLILTTDFSEGE